jgi:hypothetical protein
MGCWGIAVIASLGKLLEHLLALAKERDIAVSQKHDLIHDTQQRWFLSDHHDRDTCFASSVDGIGQSAVPGRVEVGVGLI